MRALSRVSVVAFAVLAACDSSAPPSRDGGLDVDTGVVDPDAASVDAARVPLDGGPATRIDFPAMGSLSAPGGRGSFRFGVATAATQIEETNERTDWWAWTAPTEEGGLGKGTYVGDAVRGYTNAEPDIALLTQLGVDTYRLSIEWARIEPQRDVIDEDAVAHYRALLEALRDAGIRPMVTVHHFSNPLWADDPRIDPATCTSTETQLCGWGYDGDALVEEIAEHAGLLATRFGDLVDEWGTINEPVNYIFAAYGAGQFPPGRTWALTDTERFRAVVETFIEAHVAMYAAIKAADTIDVDDDDGIAASVGIPLSVVNWIPTRNGAPSENPDDVAAAERIRYVYHYLLPDSLLHGTWDPDLDPASGEPIARPEWAGTLDWLGLQYYFRTGVTARAQILALLGLTPCVPPLDNGACLDELADPTFYVPTMRYEFYAPGFYDVVRGFADRYPDLPLAATEAGIATEVGARRAENIVRILEQIGRLRDEGVDFRGYYHWSLMDNFEWAEGYTPHFGLYSVDRTSAEYTRTATEGATVYGAICADRAVTESQRITYGGVGPMTPEP